ncbi:hypothetical protein Q73_13245 [Bacillus coahuilensis m2-6]|uniref:glycosyl hydrolase family 8 n=1 Tax=Bacillus coahuilensis TaxID=408580 RepID=UPI00075015C8|nr:glycosyl hydrolase family 8 [Bacillus coahuilensis]KUP05392.1 hypothetical protein Q73_13245 [Bacillus coahuilensis m2-6]
MRRARRVNRKRSFVKTFAVMLVMVFTLSGVWQLVDIKRSVMAMRTSLHPTHYFIEKHLMNPNDTIATYVKEDTNEDSDFVKGREAISESLGLWMMYGIEVSDQALFDKSVQSLQIYFLDRSGMVYWRLDPLGQPNVSTNALVDDLRILEALHLGYEKWEDTRYLELFQTISDFMLSHNIKNGYFIDFYDESYQLAADTISLTYMNPVTLKRLSGRSDRGECSNKNDSNYNKLQLMVPFTRYDTQQRSYEYSETVNLIDQTLIASNLNSVGVDTSDYVAFLRNEWERHGVVYGMYDAKTKEPTVSHESPALYSLIVDYASSIGETEIATKAYERMIEFQNKHIVSPYYGGYSIGLAPGDQNSHSFDNLLPLLTEAKRGE